MLAKCVPLGQTPVYELGHIIKSDFTFFYAPCEIQYNSFGLCQTSIPFTCSGQLIATFSLTTYLRCLKQGLKTGKETETAFRLST